MKINTRQFDQSRNYFFQCTGVLSGRPNRYGSVRRSAELSGSARFGGSAELAGSASRTTAEPNYYINHCFTYKKMQEQKLTPKIENIFYLKITKFSKFDLFLSKIDYFRLFKK